MEYKKLTCSDCKQEFICEYCKPDCICEYEMYPDICDCCECDSCDIITRNECADDNGYQRYCKKCK